MGADYSPILWASIAWIIIAVIGSILVRWTDDPSLYRLAIITGCICLWLMWLLVFLSQTNPLLYPQPKPPVHNAPPGNGTAARLGGGASSRAVEV